MESSDLSVTPAPSDDRAAWLTKWARDKGATHPAFDFTSRAAAGDGSWIRLAIAVDPESPPVMRANALSGLAKHFRYGVSDPHAPDAFLTDLRVLLPMQLSLEEMHGLLHLTYSLQDIRVLFRCPSNPVKPTLELTERGGHMAAGCPIAFASDLLSDVHAYLDLMTMRDFDALTIQRRLLAGEMLLTYYLHGTEKDDDWSNVKRLEQLTTHGVRIWAKLKPHEFTETVDGTGRPNTVNADSFQIVCERLRKERSERWLQQGDKGSIDSTGAAAKGSESQLREVHIVIPGAIPPGKDAEDTATINRYRVLQSPLEVAMLPDLPALMSIKNRLVGEFPWATTAIEEIFGGLCLKRRCGVLRCQLNPTLIAGRPGVGKTRFARRLAEELSLPFRAIGIGGMNDSFPLLGTSRGWSTGHPSPLLTLLASSPSPSALVLLDEVEKASNRVANSTCVTRALLGLLEPGSVRRWYDTFLQTDCDLSAMSFLLTVNSLQSLPKPFLSRCHLVMFDEPRREHIDAAVPLVLADLAKDWGLPGDVFKGYESIVRSIPVRSMRELKAALTHQLRSELVSGQHKWLH